MNKHTSILVTALFTFMTGQYSMPYAGSLDTTFNTVGIVETSFRDATPMAWAVTTQPDDKIVVAGFVNDNILLMRYNINGSLDHTLNGSGILLSAIKSYSAAVAVAIQPNGKIVVAGLVNTSLAVVRYNHDGSLDTTFNGTGSAIMDRATLGTLPLIMPRSLALQKDGKIVVVGSTIVEGDSDYAIIRYNADGSLDKTFNSSGSNPGIIISKIEDKSASACSLAIQKNGKLVVAVLSDRFTIVRHNTDGSLDTTFNGTGIVKSDLDSRSQDNVINIQKNGKIVAAVTTARFPDPHANFKITTTRYNADGSVDKTFNKHGTQPGVVFTALTETVQVKSIMLQNNGKIVVAGTAVGDSPQFVIVRYNRDGTLDTTFNCSGAQPGVVTMSVEGALCRGAALDRTGKIILAGDKYEAQGDFTVVARYNGEPVQST